MKKLIIITLFGLFLGLSGAIGIVIAREKQVRASMPPPAPDSAATLAERTEGGAPSAESTLIDAAADDSLQLAMPAADDSLNLAGLATAVDAVDAAAGPMDSAQIAATNARIAVAVAAGPEEQRLARIFAAMRPEEAARVLEQMSDPEVQRLLSHLRERQAAAIMSSIAPERAAVISSALIRAERSSP